MEPGKSVSLNIFEQSTNRGSASIATSDCSNRADLPEMFVYSAAPNPIGTGRIQATPTENVPNSDNPNQSNLNGKPKVVKFKVRRHKANARERNRMHGLNAALDRLRRCIPIQSRFQKLSKIETLRLAKNYIQGMTEMLKQDEPWASTKFAQILTNGMSQGTTTAINGYLSLDPKNLFLTEGGTQNQNPVNTYDPCQNQISKSDAVAQSTRSKEFKSSDMVKYPHNVYVTESSNVESLVNTATWDWSNGNSRGWPI